MKLTELEKRLEKHAENVKNNMTAPFCIESEEFTVMKKFNLKRLVIAAAIILCITGATVFGAYFCRNYLSAGEAAKKLGDIKLAENLKDAKESGAPVCDGEYKAAVLGIVSGEELSDFKSSSWDTFPERTYAVVAVEKTDGSPMSFDDEILVSPLIEGLSPWEYNIFTMNGGYQADIIDGVLYRIVEFDSIEYFADRKVYMAVMSGGFINNRAYAYDENTGEISPKEDFEGTNILIELTLDKSKADPEKAAEYLKNLSEAANEEEESETGGVKEIIINPDLTITEN